MQDLVKKKKKTSSVHKVIFFGSQKNNVNFFFFLHISFVHESSVFEKTCVKREIDPDAVVLDLCFLCVCVCVCVCVSMFGHHSVNVCT